MDKIKVIELTPEDSEEVQLLADMEDEEIEKEFGYTEDEELEIDDDFDEEKLQIAKQLLMKNVMNQFFLILQLKIWR